MSIADRRLIAFSIVICTHFAKRLHYFVFARFDRLSFLVLSRLLSVHMDPSKNASLEWEILSFLVHKKMDHIKLWECLLATVQALTILHTIPTTLISLFSRIICTYHIVDAQQKQLLLRVLILLIHESIQKRVTPPFTPFIFPFCDNIFCTQIFNKSCNSKEV